MRKFIPIVLSALFFSGSFAQQNVKLNIQHKLKTQNFAFNQASTNNLGNDFNLNRLQYYMSGFAIVHDGGQVTAVTGTYALVDASQTTQIDLGSQSGINTIEGITFAIGVSSPQNNQDPTLWPASHPLSPKSPSMHWGWASGYFFVALSGKGSPSLNQTIELHAMNNPNSSTYFSQTVTTGAALVNNEHIITINADYSKALRNINVSNGLVLHSTSGANSTMLTNFRDSVFSALPTQTVSTGIKNNKDAVSSFIVYPNPSSGAFTVDTKGLSLTEGSVKITDVTGKVILSGLVSNSNLTEIKVSSKGIYFMSLMDGRTELATKKIVVH